MKKSFGLSLGALSDDIEVQLTRQGLTLGDSDALFQRMANEITHLRINEIITGGESDRAQQRLLKRMSCCVRPLPAPQGGEVQP